MKIVEELKELLKQDPSDKKQVLIGLITQYFTSSEVVKMLCDVQESEFQIDPAHFSYKPKIDEFLEMACEVYACLLSEVLKQHDISNALRSIIDLLQVSAVREYISNGLGPYRKPDGCQFLLDVDFYNLGYVAED